MKKLKQITNMLEKAIFDAVKAGDIAGANNIIMVGTNLYTFATAASQHELENTIVDAIDGHTTQDAPQISSQDYIDLK